MKSKHKGTLEYMLIMGEPKLKVVLCDMNTILQQDQSRHD